MCVSIRRVFMHMLDVRRCSNCDNLRWIVPFARPLSFLATHGLGYVLYAPPPLVPDMSVYCGIALYTMTEHSRGADDRPKTVADRCASESPFVCFVLPRRRLFLPAFALLPEDV